MSHSLKMSHIILHKEPSSRYVYSRILSTPVHIVPPTPPLTRVFVRWHNQVVPPVPVFPHVKPLVFVKPYLLLPPSTSTSADSPPPSTSDLDLPIAIRNNKRTCTNHPNFVSFDHLPPFKAFSFSVSSLVVPKLYKEALSHLGWRKAMGNGSGNACFKIESYLGFDSQTCRYCRLLESTSCGWGLHSDIWPWLHWDFFFFCQVEFYSYYYLSGRQSWLATWPTWFQKCFLAWWSYENCLYGSMSPRGCMCVS